MARPALSEEKKRVVQVNIRLTQSEGEKVNTHSKENGSTSYLTKLPRATLAVYRLAIKASCSKEEVWEMRTNGTV
jgi:hypothetical protein